ncbi:MAG: tetratricopeptide repeat protein, partial [Chloroflexota bacterium]
GLLERCGAEAGRVLSLLGAPETRRGMRAVAEARHYQGTALLQGGRPAEAIEPLQSAERHYQTLGNSYGLALAHHHLGMAYRAVGAHGEALDHYLQALLGWRTLKNLPQTASTLNNLGNLYTSSGDLDRARATLEEGLAVAKTVQATRIQAYLLNSLADVHLLLGAPGEAAQHFDQSIGAAEGASELRIVLTSKIGAAMARLTMGQRSAAETVLREAQGLLALHDGALMRAEYAAAGALLALTGGDPAGGGELARTALETLGAQGSRETRLRCQFLAGWATWQQDGTADALLFALANELAQPGTERLLLLEARFALPFLQTAWPDSGLDSFFSRLRAAVTSFSPVGLVGAADPVVNGVPAVVRAFALGHSRVEIAGQAVREVQWATEKAKELFYLMLLSGGPLSKEQIVDTLWPDASPAK